MTLVGALAIVVAAAALGCLPLAPAWPPAQIRHPDGSALADAGWRWSHARWEAARLGSCAFAVLLLGASGGPLLLVAAAALVPSVAVRLRAQQARDRSRGPATRILVAAAAGLRSGLPLAEALRQGAAGCDDRAARRPVESALAAFDLGGSLDGALGSAARAMPRGPVATALEALALGVGERLPSDRIAALLGAITDRLLFEQRLALEVSARAAGARMQMWLLSAIVPALALYLALSMPALAAVLGGPLGRTVLIPGALFLEIAGVLLSRGIVRRAGC